MSPAFSGSLVKLGDSLEICDGIIFDFYPGLPCILAFSRVLCNYFQPVLLASLFIFACCTWRTISCPGVYRSKINLCPGRFMKLPFRGGCTLNKWNSPMQPCARLTDLFVVSCPDPHFCYATQVTWLMAFCWLGTTKESLNGLKAQEWEGLGMSLILIHLCCVLVLTGGVLASLDFPLKGDGTDVLDESACVYAGEEIQSRMCKCQYLNN